MEIVPETLRPPSSVFLSPANSQGTPTEPSGGDRMVRGAVPWTDRRLSHMTWPQAPPLPHRA